MRPLETLKNKLLSLGYTVNCFERADEATAYLCEKLQGRSVGFAGSMSLEKMGLYEQLSKTATVYWHHRIPEGKTSREVRTQANTAPVYITSVNAVAESGEIVNIDANCNRVASIFYGHDKVYFVIGKNKITKTYDDAVYRARNIAAPLNAKRLGVNTPCAVKADRCYDCKSPQRICRGLSVLWAPPMTGEFEILLINEDLGY
jgi:L-lactate utilization protein LutC